jgi:hypothetical protein
MLSDIRVPIRGQTIESLVAAHWLRNPWPTWDDAAKAVFGSPKTKSGSLIHGGWQEAFQNLEGAGCRTATELIERHSYLPLFRPFADATTYEKLPSALARGEVTKLSALCRSHAVRLGSQRLCPMCAAVEIAARGFAVARRQHQVAAVQACHLHGVLTLPISGMNAGSETLAEHGLYVPTLDAGHPQLKAWADELSQPASAAQIRYAMLTEAALGGSLMPASLKARQTAIAARLSERHGANRTPGTTLAGLLRASFDEAALADTGLSLASQRDRFWPALVADGTAFAHHPIANLLVASVLFDDLADLGQALQAADAASPEPRPATTSMRFGSIATVLDTPLLKDCLRDIPLGQVAHKHQIDLATLRSVLRQFPRLAKQRQRSCFRRKQTVHRASALELKRNHPRAARQDLKTLANADYAWLAQHDRGWLDARFPLLRPPRDQSHLYDIQLDTSTASIAASVSSRLASDGHSGSRRTWSLMLQCFDKETQKQLRTGKLPIAASSLRAQEESRTQYRDRLLGSIQESMAASDFAAAKSYAKDLIRSQPRDPVLLERVLSSLLPEADWRAHGCEALERSADALR